MTTGNFYHFKKVASLKTYDIISAGAYYHSAVAEYAFGMLGSSRVWYNHLKEFLQIGGRYVGIQ